MSTTPKVQVNVGSLADMGQRFSQAWNRAAAGEQVQESHVTFLKVQTMMNLMQIEESIHPLAMATVAGR